jgi:hypothetical protein
LYLSGNRHIQSSSTAVAAFVLLATLIVAPQPANALPTYAQKEGKPCEYSHVNPAGDGVRNAIGRQYEENGRTFKK